MTIDRRWYAVGAVILALSVAYYVGKKQGHLDEKLSTNQTAIHTADSVSTKDSAKVVVARKKDAVLDSAHDVVRSKVRVVHDSVLVHDSVVVVSPEIAQLIQTDDSLIASQKHSLALQDTLIASLRVGLSLRDTRIHLLESEVTPGKFKRIINATKWLAVGAVIGVAVAHR